MVGVIYPPINFENFGSFLAIAAALINEVYVYRHVLRQKFTFEQFCKIGWILITTPPIVFIILFPVTRYLWLVAITIPLMTFIYIPLGEIDNVSGRILRRLFRRSEAVKI